MKVVKFGDAENPSEPGEARICDYCEHSAVVIEEPNLNERSLDAICEECSIVEIEGPARDCAFDSTARFVRRNGTWYLEGITWNGLVFLIGRLASTPALLEHPRLEETPTGLRWSGQFLESVEPFASRQSEALIPTTCQYCGRLLEASPYTDAYGPPHCTQCGKVENTTPPLRLHMCDVYHVQRAGRWFLECVWHGTGRDGIFGETKEPPSDWTEVPGIHAGIDGWWYWDAVFVGQTKSTRTFWRTEDAESPHDLGGSNTK